MNRYMTHIVLACVLLPREFHFRLARFYLSENHYENVIKRLEVSGNKSC